MPVSPLHRSVPRASPTAAGRCVRDPRRRTAPRGLCEHVRDVVGRRRRVGGRRDRRVPPHDRQLRHRGDLRGVAPARRDHQVVDARAAARTRPRGPHRRHRLQRRAGARRVRRRGIRARGALRQGALAGGHPRGRARPGLRRLGVEPLGRGRRRPRRPRAARRRHLRRPGRVQGRGLHARPAHVRRGLPRIRGGRRRSSVSRMPRPTWWPTSAPSSRPIEPNDDGLTALWYCSGDDTPYVGAGIGAPADDHGGRRARERRRRRRTTRGRRWAGRRSSPPIPT